MKYEYRNDKHVTLHGIEPYGKKIFDHEILGGGITLLRTIEKKQDKKDKNKSLKIDEEEN